ncbi:hypothetical protein S40288_01676 [Stachybotrys chartarum IBT 40288]|nr:hypothetical protein S40288_01676 [Stachybotrys chartarum IBT 40288]
MTSEHGLSGVMSFAQRFQNLQQHRDSNDALINDLLVYCERTENKLRQEKQQLLDELQNCQLDLAAAIKSRREHQQQLQKYEQSYDWVRQENEDLKFQEHWIKKGIEGGKAAAYALRSAIYEQCGSRADDVEVVARVVANLQGLSRAMQRDGCIDNVSELKDFTLGFTQAKASFDFVDVGYGKERADSKIKGISHDAGYAPFLDEILRDEDTRQRVTLLEGFPTVHELVATKVSVLNLASDLFRKDKLIDRAVAPITRAPPSQAPLSAPPQDRPSASASAYPSPPMSSSSLASPPAPSASYANVITSVSPPPLITLPLTSRPAPPRQKTPARPQQPAWNPGPRGLDQPPQINNIAMEAIKKRKDTNKLCNNHYLRGPCAKDNCCFVHDYKPSADEIKAIAALARLNPCTLGQDCPAEDCIYGHNVSFAGPLPPCPTSGILTENLP